MTHRSLTAAAVLVSSLALLSTVPAAAGGVEPGTGFKAGGVYFHIVSIAPQSGTLFRVSQRLPGHGAVKHSGCYRVGRTFYHPDSCSALRAHFARHGITIDGLPSAPAATGNRSYAPGSHPIDYLRGTYVEPQRSYERAYGGLFYGAWLVRGPRGGGFHGGPRLGFRGIRGGFGGFARGSSGAGSFAIFGRW